MIPDIREYLKQEVAQLNKVWPANRTINIVCHGHSIPCGYTANHVVRMLDAYPHILHELLTKRFPMAVMNVIVSGVGGEASVSGAKRMNEDVLCYKPSIITIDYGRNDMFLPIKQVEDSWRIMIEKSLENEVKVILITPAPDSGQIYYEKEKRLNSDEVLAKLIRNLAKEYEIGLADVTKTFAKRMTAGDVVNDYLISLNHLNRDGHNLIAKEILQWFPYC